MLQISLFGGLYFVKFFLIKSIFKKPFSKLREVMQINLQLLQSIDNLICLKATGNAYELAKRLEISRRTVFRYLEYLREDCQLVINYCKIRETYYYSSGAKHVIYLGLRNK